MILFRARLTLTWAHREAVMRSLAGILEPTRALRGCASCRLWTDASDRNVLELAEEWTDETSLRAYLRADSFRVVLSALDYTSDPPEVRFEDISDPRGMEFIAACLEEAPPAQ